MNTNRVNAKGQPSKHQHRETETVRKAQAAARAGKTVN